MNEWLAIVAILSGLVFFISGSIGLIRLPDIFSRLHALAKADNIGLALVILGVAALETDLMNQFKLLLIWLLVLAASSVSALLVSRQALRRMKQHD